jgi:hypothetical protein
MNSRTRIVGVGVGAAGSSMRRPWLIRDCDLRSELSAPYDHSRPAK